MLCLTPSPLAYEVVAQKVHRMELVRQRNEHASRHQLQLRHDGDDLARTRLGADRHPSPQLCPIRLRETRTLQLLQTAVVERLHGGQRLEQRVEAGRRRQLQEGQQRRAARGEKEGLALVRPLGQGIQKQH